jgi:hypothetical protein
MTTEPKNDPISEVPAAKMLCGPARYAMLGLGIVAAGIGIAGVILPGLPGTVFLIIALWAFSRSSERFQLWLFNHPRFGASLRTWHTHRVIPRRAKIAAVTMMAISQAMVTILVAQSWELPLFSAFVLALVSAWILSRPSSPPETA